ncbi:hypothetical protein HanIR_Chr13g0642651 [Helianthus annuus]|nr:hypothetical protein HanIR_Chr13g0642651 [Helianthus annuus]
MVVATKLRRPLWRSLVRNRAKLGFIVVGLWAGGFSSKLVAWWLRYACNFERYRGRDAFTRIRASHNIYPVI